MRSVLLAFREGLEAALIVGIVLGALRKLGHVEQSRAVWQGVAMAVVASLAAAIGLNLIGARLEGPSENVFEGVTMFLAAGVLTWMIFWMQAQSRFIRARLEADVRRAIVGSGRGLSGLAFAAVFREGLETALFLTAAALTTTIWETILGGLLGLAAAIITGWLLFATTIRLDVKRLFQVTGVLLILFAAGLVAHGVHEFNELGWIPAVIEHVWDTNRIMDEGSVLGQVLKALFGYNGNPSLTEVAAYGTYYVIVLLSLRWRGQRLPVQV
ncbi:MAG: FTR1 family protein [Anaerolineae bacterium]